MKKHLIPIYALLLLSLAFNAVLLGLYLRVRAAPGQAAHYTLYIGTKDQHTNEAHYSQEEARALINAICETHTKGFTSVNATGRFQDDSGAWIEEDTLLYSFYDITEAQLTAIMDEVLTALNQSAILVETGNAPYRFYSGT